MLHHIILLLFPVVKMTCYEYHIQQIPQSSAVSHLEYEIIDVIDKIFPKSLEISIIFQNINGRLSIYSIDKNDNQFILEINLYDDLISVHLRGIKIISKSLSKDCNVMVFGHLETIKISVTIEDDVTLICNEQIIKNVIPFENLIPIIYDLPTELKISQSKLEKSGNSAQLFIKQTLKVNDWYQLEACILSIRHNQKELGKMDIYGINIIHGCQRSCNQDACVGGTCIETYSNKPLCEWPERDIEFKYLKEDNNEITYLSQVIHEPYIRTFPASLVIDFTINSINERSNKMELLIYTLDERNHQIYFLIIYNYYATKIRIGKNIVYQDYTLDELCGCGKKCLNTKLKIEIRPRDDTIRFRCFRHKIFVLVGTAIINTEFPLIKFPIKSKRYTGIVWSGNFPNIKNKYNLFSGTIHFIRVRNLQNKIKLWGSKLKRTYSCKSDSAICHGGQCIKSYSIFQPPECDCTMTMNNGRYCQTDNSISSKVQIKPIYTIDKLKVSWKDVDTYDTIAIFKLRNIDLRIVLENNEITIVLNENSQEKRKIRSKRDRRHKYYFLIFTVKNKNLQIENPNSNQQFNITFNYSKIYLNNYELYPSNGIMAIGVRNENENEWKPLSRQYTNNVYEDIPENIYTKQTEIVSTSASPSTSSSFVSSISFSNALYKSNKNYVSDVNKCVDVNWYKTVIFAMTGLLFTVFLCLILVSIVVYKLYYKKKENNNNYEKKENNNNYEKKENNNNYEKNRETEIEPEKENNNNYEKIRETEIEPEKENNNNCVKNEDMAPEQECSMKEFKTKLIETSVI